MKIYIVYWREKEHEKYLEQVDRKNHLLFFSALDHDGHFTDKLFDRGYISFDDTGRILISERLDDNNRMYMNITATMKIDITEENIKYIKYHRKNVFIEK